MPDGNAAYPQIGFVTMDRSPKTQPKATFHPGSWRGGNVPPEKESGPQQTAPPATMMG